MLSRAAALSVEQLIARGRDCVPSAVEASLRSLTARRVRREPMAYILGEREFWGLTFKVNPAVLVPRPDTETVIEAALSIMPERGRAWRILDLGTGSGCLLLTLLKEHPNAVGVGFDASTAALDVARHNADSLGVAGRATFVTGDWRHPGWADRLAGPFDLVVSNPPYIEAGTVDALMPEVARHEPRLALEGGTDGLEAYRAIAAAAPKLVTPGGCLLVEAGAGQAADIAGILSSFQLAVLPFWRDLGGIERVVGARH